MANDQEYEKFKAWLIATSRGFNFIAPSQQNYRSSGLYKEWVKAGKPADIPAVSETAAIGPASPVPNVPEVVSLNGWDFVPEYDLSGNLVGYTPLGRTETPEIVPSWLTPAQQEASRQFEKTFAFNREQLEQAQYEKQAGLKTALENRRAAELYSAMTPQAQISPEERARMFEQIRGDVLGSIQSPRNWIQYLQVKNAPNPYTPAEADMESSYNRLTDELKRATSVADIVRGRLKDLNDPLTPAALANPKTTEEQLASIALKNESDLKGKLLEFQISRGQGAANQGGLSPGWMPAVLSQEEAKGIAQQQYWANPRPIGASGDMVIGGGPGSSNEPQLKGILPIPPWLSEYVPGLKGYEFLEKAPKSPIERPSSQSWQRLSDTQAQMLGGYADWSGQDWSEILRQMSLEKPQAAATPRRSSPFMQR